VKKVAPRGGESVGDPEKDSVDPAREEKDLATDGIAYREMKKKESVRN